MSRFGHLYARQDIVLKGVYTDADVSRLVSPSGVPSRAVAILATALGGNVGEPTRCTDPDDITNLFVGGMGAILARALFAASPTLGGATNVYLLRVNKAIAATLSVGDATLTARMPGNIGNAIKFDRTQNTDGISWDITIKHTQLSVPPETYKNVGLALRIDFKAGTGTPTMAVTLNSGVITVALTKTVAATPTTFNFTSVQYPKLADLATAINNLADWDAVLEGPLLGLLTTDLAVSVPAFTTNTAHAMLTGRALEIIGDNSNLITAVAAVGAASAISAFLSGGSEGAAVVTQDYLDALALATQLDVMGIVCGTGDLAVNLAGSAHVQNMSNAKARKERYWATGVDKSASKTAFVTALKTMQTAIGGSRVWIAGIEPKLVTPETSKLDVYPSYVAAAFMLGIKAGNNANMSTTRKPVSMLGSSYKFEVEDLEDFVENGLTPFAFINNQWCIADGITSYTTQNNIALRTQQGIDATDTLNKNIRLAVDRFIGEYGDEAGVKDILGVVKTTLQAQVRTPKNGAGLLTGGINPATNQRVPPYHDISVEFGTGGLDVVAINYNAHLVGEIGFIFATAHITPVKIIATA